MVVVNRNIVYTWKKIRLYIPVVLNVIYCLKLYPQQQDKDPNFYYDKEAVISDIPRWSNLLELHSKKKANDSLVLFGVSLNEIIRIYLIPRSAIIQHYNAMKSIQEGFSYGPLKLPYHILKNETFIYNGNNGVFYNKASNSFHDSLEWDLWIRPKKGKEIYETLINQFPESKITKLDHLNDSSICVAMSYINNGDIWFEHFILMKKKLFKIL